MHQQMHSVWVRVAQDMSMDVSMPHFKELRLLQSKIERLRAELRILSCVQRHLLTLVTEILVLHSTHRRMRN